MMYTKRYEGRYATPLPDYSQVRTLWAAKERSAAMKLCASGDLWLRWATGMFQLPQPPSDRDLADHIKAVQRSVNTLRDEFGIDSWPPVSADGAMQKRLNKYLSHFVIDFTFESNAIEGSTLTWLKTAMVIDAAKKGLDHHSVVLAGEETNADEALDHATAWDWILNDLLPKVPVWELTETHIRHLHALVTRRTLKETAGVYRSDEMVVSGAAVLPPHPEEVPRLMAKLVSWLQSLKPNLKPPAEGRYRYASRVEVAEASLDAYHPVTLGALVHLFFVTIHPFEDGNGRTARLLLNYVLMSLSLPPINVRSERIARELYMEALSAFSTTQSTEQFVTFMHHETQRQVAALAARIRGQIKPKLQ